MIVVKMWTTVKNKRYGFHYEGREYSCRTREWKGYFLFGLIPLWIENERTSYTHLY